MLIVDALEEVEIQDCHRACDVAPTKIAETFLERNTVRKASQLIVSAHPKGIIASPGRALNQFQEHSALELGEGSGKAVRNAIGE